MRKTYIMAGLALGLAAAAGLKNLTDHRPKNGSSGIAPVTLPDATQTASFTLPQHGVIAFENGVVEVRTALGHFKRIERYDFSRGVVSHCSKTGVRMARDLAGNRVDPCIPQTTVRLTKAFIGQGNTRTVLDFVRQEAAQRGLGKLREGIAFYLQ